MFCKYCGQKLNEGDEFCTNCGAKKDSNSGVQQNINNNQPNMNNNGVNNNPNNENPASTADMINITNSHVYLSFT